MPGPPVLLHADLTDEHLLLTEEGDGWVISGLIDFGDAKVGDAKVGDAKVGDAPYEFLAPIADLTFGEPELTHVLLKSYGLVLDSPMRESITTYCLLHEFGTIKDFLARSPASDPDAFRELCGVDELALTGRMPQD